MDELIKRYYKLGNSYFVVLGLSPYNISKFTKIQNCVYVLFIFSSLLVQIFPLITLDFSLILLFKSFPCMFIITAVLMLYIVFMIKKEDVKNIMEKVKYDWDTVKTIDELNLLKEYAKKGKFYINTFSLVTYSCLAVTWLTPFTNELLDLVKPLNESRSRKFPILVELFIDQEKFHYPISFIFNLLLLMSSICIIATQYVTTMWYQHVLSLFEIIRCRTNEAFTYVPLSIHVSERTSKMMNILTSTTVIHERAIKFLDYILSKFRVLYFILVAISVVVLSICFFFIFQAFMCRTYDNEHLFITSALCLILYMFYWNYLIQQMIDSYNNVFIQLYTVDWYNAPLCVQKLILTMMIRYTSPISINFFGIYSPSMKGFFLLFKATWSYFIVLSSTQTRN